MDTPFNKPRVFLSHAKADAAFIQRLDNDLRHCQIDTWLDEIEIRHGQPWLDAIFEAGIPTCDCVLVYLTENSIRSNMVKKEIDASIIRKLKDVHVGLLPYVSHADLRDQLRADIQILQTPEWNDDNYHEILPRVVAEVWHSYTDRSIVQATAQEKTQRLEAQIELEALKKQTSDGIFSLSEEKDFSFIRETLDREESVVLSLGKPSSGEAQEPSEESSYSVNMLALFLSFAQEGRAEITEDKILWKIEMEILEQDFPDLYALRDKSLLQVSHSPVLFRELIMFGLVSEAKYYVPPTSDTKSGFHWSEGHVSSYCEFPEKAQRFRYWLAVNGHLPHRLTLRPIQPFTNETLAEALALLQTNDKSQ